MKKLIGTFGFLAVFLLGVLVPTASFADVFTFVPTPADLWNLDHYKYYRWGIDWALPAQETIESAKITYNDIYNWARETNDKLYTHLLDSATAGTYAYTDNQGGGDNFDGQGYLFLPVYSDPDDFLSVEDLSYDIPEDYFSYLSDGNFGFGIDPDCHYYNTGIVFEIVTRPQGGPPTIPEPSTLLLLGFGLVGLAGLKKKLHK